MGINSFLGQKQEKPDSQGTVRYILGITANRARVMMTPRSGGGSGKEKETTVGVQ